MLGDDVLRIRPRQRRDHLAIVAPRGAPPRLGRFDDRDVDARLAQMQRGGKTGKRVPVNSGSSGPWGVTAAHSELGQRTLVVFIVILSCGRAIVLLSLSS